MGITIIPNQPIMFRNVSEEQDGCECNEQSFCQIINELDETQFQIRSTNSVLNPNFDGVLDPWYSQLPIQIQLVVTNVSPEGDCDGSISLSSSNYSAPISYSLNGGDFVPVMGSDIDFNDLCEGYGFATVRDSEGNEASVEFYIVENINCSLYDSTDELLPFQTSQLINCLTSDFI